MTANIVADKLAQMKTKVLHKEYTTFIGRESHADYYLKRFIKFDDGKKTISFNISAFLFSTCWCFYRKLFGLGAIFLAMNFCGLYVSLTQPHLSLLGNLLAVIPALACGLFGNQAYHRYVQSHIAKAMDMSESAKAKHYDDNGGTSTRIVLGIVAAYVFFSLALFFSAGPEAIEKMQQSLPTAP